jgi:hypothetical protein
MRVDRPKCGPDGTPVGISPMMLGEDKPGIGVGIPMSPDAMRVLAYLLVQMADGVDGKIVSVQADHYVTSDESSVDH